jgi:lysophospholipase L1-like esterase
MRFSRPRTLLLGALAIGWLTLRPLTSAQSGRIGEHWVGTWATAEVGRPQMPPPPPAGAPAAAAPPAPFMHFTNQTLRQIVHASVGGSRTRVVFSNVFGTRPLTIGEAHLALRGTGAAIVSGSDRKLTFSGRPTVTMASGALIYTDPVEIDVPPMTDVAIDMYLPGDTNSPSPVTMHNAARQTNYVSETGNHAGVVNFPVVATTASWFLLARLEVVASEAAGAIVAFGDSITDGTGSTPEANHRWPDLLARRLLSEPGGAGMAVLNAGIGGNRVLSELAFGAGINALARFETHVLGQTGVTHVIVLEGINDIGNARQNPTPTGEDLIAAHKQLIERAHTRGLKIIGATLTPYEGAPAFTPEGETKRTLLNEWIRTSRSYDGVIDFDLATRDPSSPLRFLAKYDSGDHLHPSDAGYQAMANVIDLDLFKSKWIPARSR